MLFDGTRLDLGVKLAILLPSARAEILGSDSHVVKLMNKECFDEAKPLGNKALKIALKVNQPELIANTYSNLGFLASQKGDFDEAESLYLEALKINSDLGGSEDLSVAMVLCNLGLLKYSQNGHSVYYRSNKEYS